MPPRAKSFSDEQVIAAIVAGRTVITLDSGSSGDDDIFLTTVDFDGDMTIEEAEELMAEHLETDELPDDYAFAEADEGTLAAILWDLPSIRDYDEIEAIMAERRENLSRIV